MRKRFELFRTGANDERKQLRVETQALKQQIENLENAVMKNIQGASNATETVTDAIKGNIRDELDRRRDFLKTDIRNVVSQFRENVTEEIVDTFNHYSAVLVGAFTNDSSEISRLAYLSPTVV